MSRAALEKRFLALKNRVDRELSRSAEGDRDSAAPSKKRAGAKPAGGKADA